MKIKKNVQILNKGILLFILMFYSLLSYAIDCKNASLPADLKREELVQSVISPNRLYLHTYPDESCKDKMLFVIKDDLVFSFGSINGFTFVRYNASSKAVYGWVKTEGLAVKEFGPIEDGAPITVNDFYLSNGQFTIRPNNTLDYLMSKSDWFKENIVSCRTFYRDDELMTWLDQDEGLDIDTVSRKDDLFARFIGASAPNHLRCKDAEGAKTKEFANQIMNIGFVSGDDYDYGVKTLRGIGIGSNEAELRKAYGDTLEYHTLSFGVTWPTTIYSTTYENFELTFEVVDLLGVVNLSIKNTQKNP